MGSGFIAENKQVSLHELAARIPGSSPWRWREDKEPQLSNVRVKSNACNWGDNG